MSFFFRSIISRSWGETPVPPSSPPSAGSASSPPLRRTSPARSHIRHTSPARPSSPLHPRPVPRPPTPPLLSTAASAAPAAAASVALRVVVLGGSLQESATVLLTGYGWLGGLAWSSWGQVFSSVCAPRISRVRRLSSFQAQRGQPPTHRIHGGRQ